MKRANKQATLRNAVNVANIYIMHVMVRASYTHTKRFKAFMINDEPSEPNERDTIKSRPQNAKRQINNKTRKHEQIE